MLKNVSQNEAVDKVKTEKLNIFESANWPTNISFSSHLLFPSSGVARGFLNLPGVERDFRDFPVQRSERSFNF